MKKIIRFYAICCLGNCIYHYIVDYIFVLYGDTDLYYGFVVGIWFIFMLYAPLCTLSAYIFSVSKISKSVIRYPLLYSLSPFIISDLITYLIPLNLVFRDYLLTFLIIIENLLIIIMYCYKRFTKSHYVKHIQEKDHNFSHKKRREQGN